MRWPSCRTAWTRFRRRTPFPVRSYSDLAKIYEKAVQLPNGGSITIIAVTTLSGRDITHAIPDNTGYITKGSCSCATTPTRARSSWTRSVRCRV
ncbi:MAG: hypothetical protein V8Q54_11250 [Alistipes senegalensis]